MIKIKRALISVSDKTGIVELARALQKLGVQILSTGGTSKLLREHNIPVTEVSDYTGSPEILDGRVKTLHPKIHAGLLALRNNPSHMQKLKDLKVGLIDMAVINLYPFEKTVALPHVTQEEAIENIDIGGPSMLRSAAKNHRFVVVVSSPAHYAKLIQELKEQQGSVSEATAGKFACGVFALTSGYDRAINEYLSKISEKSGSAFFKELQISLAKVQDLRYGENPHQKAALYALTGKPRGLAALRQRQGKELSFNNILDLNSAWELVKEFKTPAAAIIKHTNPCGVAQGKSLASAFKDALSCDPRSAFGGIVGLNRAVDNKTATVIAESGFLECIIAPSFSAQALQLFSKKKNLRILELGQSRQNDEYDLKKISGAVLVQDKDTEVIEERNCKTVTKKKPTAAQRTTLMFAWKVAKHVKSNAIVLAKATKTVGIGAGQMSRVDSVLVAKAKAGARSQGSCLASDGFFPKADSIVKAASMGVKAIIQPGGSIADPEIIKACDKYKIAMVVTGIRHFKH